MARPEHQYASRLNWGQFRLFELMPTSSSSDAPSGKFIITSIHQPPPFRVLSYRWGLAGATDWVVCDSGSIAVTLNLVEALRDIRHPMKRQLYWIDPICINQQDPREKGVQVGMMAQIISIAEETVLYINSTSPTIGTAFELLSHLSFARHNAFGYRCLSSTIVTVSSLGRYREALLRPTDPSWRTVKDLLSDGVFERLMMTHFSNSVWSMQDFLCASKLTLRWNGHEIGASELCSGLEAYELHAYPNLIKHPRAHTLADVGQIRREFMPNSTDS
ncbi:hypothetical protein OQA88_3163, partial [Cercophora sp. LCS_1]